MPNFAAELRDGQRREQWAYDAGHGDGYEAGYAAAHEEMAAWWAHLATTVRSGANRPSHAGRRERELERAKPRPGDFTGRLEPQEYFADAPERAA